MAAIPSTASADQPAPAGARARSESRAWPRWEVAALAALTVVGLVLRLNNGAQVPAFTDNLDEIQFTWAGLNLILHGDAYTWAFHGYASYGSLRAFGITFPMVHHWMDHPPLFALLMGGWVWLLGVRDMLAITANQVRVPPIVFSTLTVPLTHLLGRRLLPAPASLCGAALLAVAPGAILLGRQAEPESLIAVLLLVALLLTLRAVEGGAGPWTVAGLLACCLAAPLLKVPGVAVAGICAVILVAHGAWRLAAAVASMAVFGLLAFVFYGGLVDWAQFLRGWAAQTSARNGVMAGFDFITAPAGVNRRLRDGWWIAGWLGLVLVVALRGGRTRELFLAWPAAAYAAAMLVMSGEAQAEQYGWYRQAIYPEVYLAAGYLTWEAVSRHSPALLTLVLVLGGATATEWWLGGPSRTWVPDPFLLVLVFAVIVGPSLLATWRRDRPVLERVAMGAGATGLALVMLGNLVESVRLDQIFTRM